MILVISILTPFTMATTIFLFQGFHIIQTRMMVLSVIHGLRSNQKLKACANLNHLWGSSLASHNLFSQAFFLPLKRIHPVYAYHEHTTQILYWGLQCTTPCIESTADPGNFPNSATTSCFMPNWPSDFGWEHQNLYVWAPVPLFACRADYRCLEPALIQEWQPRPNDPFICQFFHPRKGILKKASHEHQCSVRPGYPLAQTTSGQRYFDL